MDSPDEQLAAGELREVVEATIKALPEDLRAALTLREYDGLSYEEIAAVMECPVGTVRSRIFRAREAVDKQVERLMNGDL
jgi:RNA polymerase sigma-70 factor (ECF subfamily)